MQQRSVKLLADQNGFNDFEPFLSSTLNCLSLFIVCTGGHRNVSGVGARLLCPFPFQLDPQSRWPFTLLTAGFCLWSSEGTKVTIPVELYMLPRFNVIVKCPQICMDLRAAFEAGTSCRLHVPDCLPNLCPLSPAGIQPPPVIT